MSGESLNTALAAAARRVRAANERLPDGLRIDMAAEWSALLEHIEGQSNRKAVRQVDEWVDVIERRLCGTLLNAPLTSREDA